MQFYYFILFYRKIVFILFYRKIQEQYFASEAHVEFVLFSGRNVFRLLLYESCSYRRIGFYHLFISIFLEKAGIWFNKLCSIQTYTLMIIMVSYMLNPSKIKINELCILVFWRNVSYIAADLHILKLPSINSEKCVNWKLLQ